MDRKGAIVFSDGSCVVGKGFGASTERTGELVFNTSMAGYQEAVTDPSYAGQILVFSYPLIGNYGVNTDDMESPRVWVEGVVVTENCVEPSHYKCSSNFSDFLQKHGIPGVSGVDTRALVCKIRDEGVKPAAIKVWDELPEPDVGKEAKEMAKKIREFSYSAQNFVEVVSPKKHEEFIPKKRDKTVVLVDCGCKKSIIENLVARNCAVVRVPYNTNSKEIMKYDPDGVMFSNGPGDPKILKDTVKCCRELFGKTFVFGVCLGNQVIGQALGGKTVKLKFGHRGGNHAVKDLETGKVYITSQNHGYAVTGVPKGKEWFVNCLDGSNEGIKCEEAMSVQFHPEAHLGPLDTQYLFEEFMKRL
ncbi:glutamine-hydrolyzing carbamoyl-phosphate synthase small subunit [Candidatus Micrarchaeota archaeon]|nr:glutamine-hydrolyzing carbamoyl-phosphate synthase small subunit [Candidatus Micrarchaeota archaeon]